MDSNQRQWSDQQKLIFENFRTDKDNLVVVARAGTGKTTTIVQAIEYAPQNKILLAAFNKKIAEELKTRLKNPRAEAKTLHSIGFGFVRSKFPKVRLDEDRGIRLAAKATLAVLSEQNDFFATQVKRLASVAKGACPDPTFDVLADLAYEFDLDPEEGESWTINNLTRAARLAMDMAAVLDKDCTIDFDDMVFVPVRNKLMTGRYDLVVIDEAQDMNAAQLELAQGVAKKNGKIVVVGDDRQAIYGFRGADSNSIARLHKALDANELKLTTTYRCPKLVVDAARKLVPDFHSAPNAQLGEIGSIDFSKLHEVVKPGNFVLSRKNAALVKICLRLLRHNVRAMVEGKDVGKHLLGMIKKVGGSSIENLLSRVNDYVQRQKVRLTAAKKSSAEKKIEFLEDQSECLSVLAEDCATVSDLVRKIEALFTETPEGKASYVICSSVHKAKGLESDVVFIAQETLYPGGRSNIEEENIEYVAITRARRRLVWLTGVEGSDER